jgi:hypothetical protein
VKNFDEERVARAIADRLRPDFEGIEIVTVNVAPDRDQYGDDILSIEVVFEGNLKGDDALHVAGAGLRLRPVLEEIDTDLYPLISFVSKVDYDRGHRRRAGR